MDEPQQPPHSNPVLPCVRQRLLVQVPDTQEIVPLTREVMEEIQAKMKGKLLQNLAVDAIKEPLAPLFFPPNGLSTQMDDILPTLESIYKKFSVYGGW
jgi:hypothetical protein